jgi:hypothetical protein
MAVLMTFSVSLRVHESREPLSDYMNDTSYRSPGSEACMSNLNTISIFFIAIFSVLSAHIGG